MNPTTILIDCDGVLTDGKMYIDSTGEKMFKAFHSRDVRALRELVARGYYVVITTADDSDITKSFAKNTGCELLHIRDKSKIEFENYIAIGDDAWDVPMLKKASMAFCPANADVSVLRLPNINILTANGGEGVIAKMLYSILVS